MTCLCILSNFGFVQRMEKVICWSRIYVCSVCNLSELFHFCDCEVRFCVDRSILSPNCLRTFIFIRNGTSVDTIYVSNVKRSSL